MCVCIVCPPARVLQSQRKPRTRFGFLRSTVDLSLGQPSGLKYCSSVFRAGVSRCGPSAVVCGGGILVGVDWSSPPPIDSKRVPSSFPNSVAELACVTQPWSALKEAWSRDGGLLCESASLHRNKVTKPQHSRTRKQYSTQVTRLSHRGAC